MVLGARRVSLQCANPASGILPQLWIVAFHLWIATIHGWNATIHGWIDAFHGWISWHSDRREIHEDDPTPDHAQMRRRPPTTDVSCQVQVVREVGWWSPRLAAFAGLHGCGLHCCAALRRREDFAQRRSSTRGVRSTRRSQHSTGRKPEIHQWKGAIHPSIEAFHRRTAAVHPRKFGCPGGPPDGRVVHPTAGWTRGPSIARLVRRPAGTYVDSTFYVSK